MLLDLCCPLTFPLGSSDGGRVAVLTVERCRRDVRGAGEMSDGPGDTFGVI